MHKFSKILLASLALSSSLYASKLISIGGSITETVVALGHKDDLIAVDISSNYPKEALKDLPNVGYWLQLPKEGILSLKPNMVITSEKSKPKQIIKDLPKFGIKTFVIEDKASIESAKNKIMQVAKALNEEEKAKQIIKRMDKNIKQVRNEISTLKKEPKVLFLFSRGKGMQMAAGKETKIGKMIELAGGKNVIDFAQYTKISPESILQMNPDIVIYSNHRGPTKVDNKNFALTNAGKNNQIHFMDISYVSGFTVRTDSALKDLSCNIHNKQLSYCKK